MTEFDKYLPGTPCWVDVSTTDADGARAFYEGLFGWDFDIGDAEAGFYTNCMLRGRRVAGLMGLTPEMSAQGVPPAWSTYIATEDVHDSAARVTEAGGQIMMPPMDVMEYGKMAFAIDPTGAGIGFWQPGTHQGAGLANEKGAVAWNELQTRDLATATAFYGAVAGWTTEDMSAEGDPAYLIAKVGGDQVAGMMDISATAPPSRPAFWLTYFNVEDCDESVEKVRALGGSVMMARVDSPQGPFGVVADPFGAVFAVISDPTG